MFQYTRMITTALGYTPVQTDTNTWRDVIDNLTSTATDKSLSANQGKVLDNSKVNVSDIIDSVLETDSNKPLI